MNLHYKDMFKKTIKQEKQPFMWQNVPFIMFIVLFVWLLLTFVG